MNPAQTTTEVTKPNPINGVHASGWRCLPGQPCICLEGRDCPCHDDGATSPAQRIEDAEYDLELAKHMWSGRSLKEIDGDLVSARAEEQSAILNRGDTAGAQLARFAIQKERTRALTYFACVAELRAAKGAAGVE